MCLFIVQLFTNVKHLVFLKEFFKVLSYDQGNINNMRNCNVEIIVNFLIEYNF